MIILNENKYAYTLICEKTLGDNSFTAFKTVARFYIDQGYSKAEVRDKLDKYLLKCDQYASLPKWSDIIDSALAAALKRPTIIIDSVIVTKPELETISDIKEKPVRRLAFTLLCLAKYWNMVNETDAGWVNTEDTEIKKMANIKTSITRESDMYRTLRDKGLIEFSKKIDNLNVKVLFAQDGEPAMEITDFKNLGNQYLLFIGEPYCKCENCGTIFKLPNNKLGSYKGKGRPPKYCKACHKKMADIQSTKRYLHDGNPELYVIKN